jgi:hypothetical protein
VATAFFSRAESKVVPLPPRVSLTDGIDVHTAFSDLQATAIDRVNGVPPEPVISTAYLFSPSRMGHGLLLFTAALLAHRFALQLDSIGVVN